MMEYFDLDKTKLINNNRISFFRITHCGTMIQEKSPNSIELKSFSNADYSSYVFRWFSAIPPFNISPEDLKIAHIKCILVNHNTSKIFDDRKKPIYVFLKYRYSEYDIENYEYCITFDSCAIDFDMVTRIEAMLVANNNLLISDIEETDVTMKSGFNYSTLNDGYEMPKKFSIPMIKEVIFNEPYTIIKWIDGKTTKVGCKDGEVFNEELGLSVAIARRYYESICSVSPRMVCKRIVKNAKHYVNKKPARKLLPAGESED